MKGSEHILRGVMASHGMAIGHAVRAFDPQSISFNYKIRSDQTAAEVERFHESVEKSRYQLKRMQVQLKRRSGPESSFLIDAHLLILQDRLFVDRIIERIEKEHLNTEWAIELVSEELFEAYNKLEDDYLRERRGDLEDVVRRMLHNLSARSVRSVHKIPNDTILVGKSIPPSTLFELRTHRIAGVVTETGTPLSHTAIMARSLEIPAVMGIPDLSEISSGDQLIVDGTRGLVIASPSEETLREYQRQIKETKRTKRHVHPRGVPFKTEDGFAVSLGANINFGEEVHSAVNEGVDFIGLYRTEFDFFRDGKTPDEDDLSAHYSAVLEAAKPAVVTFRTIDVGIDQQSWDGASSNLGVRGLRFCLENQDIFRTQLRALYRASTRGKARILLPFVSTIDDLDAALEIIADVRRELTRRKAPYDPDVPIGVMIETPAAAQTCDLMASRVDFFCLGTNDLIQYYLVIDRSDRSVLHLYNPFHPAILRCLHQIYTLLEPTGKPITVCGEMASDPPSAAVLLGLGFTSFSVSLAAYSRMKDVIGAMRVGQLRDMARDILKMQKPKEVEEKVRAVISSTPISRS